MIGKDIELNASNSITLNAQQMNVNVDQTNWTENYTMVGEAGFNGVLFDPNIHSSVMAGPTNTGPVIG